MTSGQDEEPVTPTAHALPTPIRPTDEILFRQIHPSLLQDGVISSAVFIPTMNDDGKLSVDRSSKTTTTASFDLYIGSGRASVAVCGVTVEEYDKENIPCYPDPLEAMEILHANPAHAYADFNAFGTNQRRKLAQRLRNVATVRGFLHRIG